MKLGIVKINYPVISLVLLLMGCSASKNITKGKQIIIDDKIYVLYNSDHEAPKKMKGFLQFEYESVYAIQLKNYSKSKLSKGIRLSEIGYKRSPIWNKKGEKIAFLSFIVKDTMQDKIGHIEIRNIANGNTKVLKDMNACTCGLS